MFTQLQPEVLVNCDVETQVHGEGLGSQPISVELIMRGGRFM
jgi:hypothetical protein